MHMKCRYCGSTQHEEKDCKKKKVNILVIFSVLIILTFCLQTSMKNYQRYQDCCISTTSIDRMKSRD